jgi:hypothetical protein
VYVTDAESEFSSSLFGTPLNRSFNNLMVFNASARDYISVSGSFQRVVDQEFNPEVQKQILLKVLPQLQSGNAPKIFVSASKPGEAAESVQPIAGSNHVTPMMTTARDTPTSSPDAEASQADAASSMAGSTRRRRIVREVGAL